MEELAWNGCVCRSMAITPKMTACEYSLYLHRLIGSGLRHTHKLTSFGQLSRALHSILCCPFCLLWAFRKIRLYEQRAGFLGLQK